MAKRPLFAFSWLVIAGLLATSALALTPIPTIRQTVSAVSTELARQGYEPLPGEGHKPAEQRSILLYVFAPAGGYAAAAIPDISCTDLTMTVTETRGGRRYSGKFLAGAQVARFTLAKETEITVRLSSSHDGCLASLLGFHREVR